MNHEYHREDTRNPQFDPRPCRGRLPGHRLRHAHQLEEAKDLSITVENRDKSIEVLQGDNKKYRTEATAQKSIADAMQARNENLLAQNQDLLRKIALRDAGVGNDNMLAKDPNAPNPPS